MTEEEGKKYLKFFDENSKDKQESVSAIDGLLLINLEHVRKFTASLLVLSITLLAGIFAIFSTYEQSISNKSLVILGAVLLSLNSLFIAIYTNYVLVFEHNRLNKRKKSLSDSYDGFSDLARNLVITSEPFVKFQDKELEMLKKLSEEETEEIKGIESAFWLKIEWTYFFTGCLVLALFLINWGLFDWSFIMQDFFDY